LRKLCYTHTRKFVREPAVWVQIEKLAAALLREGTLGSEHPVFAIFDKPWRSRAVEAGRFLASAPELR
jgi:hypothetical protein